jgi:hypothetical protein
MNTAEYAVGTIAAVAFAGILLKVAAELAVGLPALVALLLAGLTAVGAVTTQLRCVSAARDAALAAARGESGDEAGRRTAPAGATVSITREGDTVRASVRAPVRPLGGLLPRLAVSASAVAAVEPGTG